MAEENGADVGVAPGCALMPIRTTGFLDDESIEDIFNWAIDKGASVIFAGELLLFIFLYLCAKGRQLLAQQQQDGTVKDV